MEALSIKLLQRLSSSLMSVEEVAPTEHRNKLRELRKKVGLSFEVLRELCRCADQASLDGSVSPVSRKKSRSVKLPKLDPYPFDCMGVKVPTAEREVHAARGDILLRLQGIFRVRVSLFPWLASGTYRVPGLPARPKATRGVRCIQEPAQGVSNHNRASRLLDPAHQGCSVLRKRRGVRGVADLSFNEGTEVSTRGQAWQQRHVRDSGEENKVTADLSAPKFG